MANICKKCKFLSTDTFSNKQLDELEKNINEMKINKEKRIYQLIENLPTEKFLDVLRFLKVLHKISHDNMLDFGQSQLARSKPS